MRVGGRDVREIQRVRAAHKYYTAQRPVCFYTVGISLRSTRGVLLRLQKCRQHEYSFGPLVFGKSLVLL